ncbi:hypothetical protein P0082_01230 [Candidatus Haliotispira prima]|uniref:Death-on-curing family protein n=1 Tax=Candidatus Haliotispira prima TaxID=3034016 RepID=A0ABY8MHM1_9SPIO|nr:hypothetical protein P0082_01230 [Candidatus Haliotispira prima]
MIEFIEEDTLLLLVEEHGFQVRDRELLLSPLGNIQNHLGYAPYYLGLEKERSLGVPRLKSQVAYIALCYLDYFGGIQSLADGNKRLALAVFLRFLERNRFTCQLAPERLRDLITRLIESNERTENNGLKASREFRLRKYHKPVETNLSMEKGRAPQLAIVP